MTARQVRASGGDSHSTSLAEDSSRVERSTPPPAPSPAVPQGVEEPGMPNPAPLTEPATTNQSPLGLLFSDSDDESVKQIRVEDNGSHPQLARVDVHGVPADGIIDTAADITIMGGKLFALVATTAKLRKRNFKKPDKVPRNYDGREFHLDGCMDMDITFHGKTMSTTVYIKMDAVDQLLLSEGVSRQLGIVTYHPSVIPRGATRPKVAVVPSIKVSLVQSLKLTPGQSALVPVELEPLEAVRDQVLLIEGEHLIEQTGLVLEDAVVHTPRDGTTHLVLTNMSGLTWRVPGGTVVGEAQGAVVITPGPRQVDTPPVDVRRLSSALDEDRRKRLMQLLPLQHVPQLDAEQLHTFLANNHDIFCLQEGERGSTALVTMEIDTGDTTPKKQPPRRMPFMEVARQLKNMQQDGVIQPSNSPWSSPVVMVRKKDGSHRFCVDYRALNSLTKADTFPLPRIADLPLFLYPGPCVRFLADPNGSRI